MKTAIVTGASRGIGREIALQLSRDGYSVMLTYNKNQQGAAETVNIIRSNGGTAAAIKCDISSSIEAADLISYTYDMFKDISLLVNNAGIAFVKLFTDCTDDDISNIIGVNLIGALNCSREALRIMIPKHKGKIINIASMWGEVGASCEVVYSAAKAGLIGFTKALAKEVALSGIAVNCVSPGIVSTDMIAEFSDKDINQLKEQIPLGRIATPNDIAEAVSFLASNRSNYITGHVLSVNGGMVI